MPGSQAARVIHFGAFEVDLRSGELRRNGLKVKLQGQPFQVLEMLLERPGEVITREELRRKLWPADTFVDFEHSLNAAIKRLRDTLGDSAETPVFIETLPRRGYRFLVPISGDGTSAGAKAVAPSMAPRRRFSWSSRMLIVFGGVAGLTMAGYVVQRHWQIFPGRPTEDSAPAMKVLPFTTFPGSETDPAFSPDGKQVAFAWEQDAPEGTGIYVGLVGGENPLRVTHSPGSVCCPVWSPDGRYLAFARCSGGPCGAFVIPALGGAERKLTERAACVGLSWSFDGKFLAFSTKDSAAEPWHISVLSLDSMQERRVTSPPGNIIGDHRPSFSPDGRTVASMRISSPWVTDVYVASVEGGESRRLTFDNTVVNGIAWAPDGKAIVFATHRAVDMSLWRIPVAGGTPQRLPVSGTNASRPTISRQGDKLAYTAGLTHPNIWELDLDAVGRAILPARQLMISSVWDGGPQFSPDGSKIVFQSFRSGTSEIWTANADGSYPHQLTSLNSLSGTPRWSPDGRYITFDSRSGDHSHIFVVPAVGGVPRQITDGTFEESVPSWSRNGKWIYFTTNKVGIWQLYKVSPQGGEAVQVTKKGGFAAFESPDGNSLYYSKDNDYGIWKMPLTGAEETRVLPQSLDWGQWAVLTNGIYFVDQNHAKPTVSFLDFATRRIRPIANVDKSLTSENPSFDVSPDGRSVLFVQVEKVGDIMLVENFR